MIRIVWFAFVCCLSSIGLAAESDFPVPRSVNYDWMSISSWYRLHADDVSLAYEGKAEIVFLGDSITEGWDGRERRKIFDKYFSKYETVNFGIGGDQTQNLLWRLQNSTKGNLDPKVAVLMIGVNNFLHSKHQPAQVAKGVAAVLSQVKLNYPNARILLHAILPYDELPEHPGRKLVDDTNKLLKAFDDDETVYFYNFGQVFLDNDSKIPRFLMADFLHPTAEGMKIWGAPLSKVIDNWFKEFVQASQQSPKN